MLLREAQMFAIGFFFFHSVEISPTHVLKNKQSTYAPNYRLWELKFPRSDKKYNLPFPSPLKLVLYLTQNEDTPLGFADGTPHGVLVTKV